MRDGQRGSPARGAALLVATGAWLAYRAVRRARTHFEFQGRTVVITGGSRGLGFALARQCVVRGARVAILGRDEAALGRAHARLAGAGGEILALACDVTDPDAVRAALAVVRDLLGPADVLIGNAGTIGVGPLDSMTPADFEEALATNFWGVLHPVLAALPDLRRRPGGRIVVVSSIGGKLGIPHLVPYCVSKFAVAGLAHGLRAELAREGVKVTAVFPGLMRTGSPRHASFKGRHRAEYAWFSISDSLPVLSVNAERAAHRILEACRRGDAELVFPLPARIAVLLQALAPGVTAAALDLVNRALPDHPGGPTAAWSGEASHSAFSPSVLTRLGDAAERAYNQVPATAGAV
jgi:NAD(P)-dependent dehydrogenase (short-subunit alcohol dehydrogenase family)